MYGNPQPISTIMPLGGFVFPPTGWIQFYKGSRTTGYKPETISAGPYLMRNIGLINNKLNREIKYVPDVGKDRWNIADKWGDCEDIALYKRKFLSDEGLVPFGAMTMAVCYVNDRVFKNRGHAVLLIEGTTGTWVLDNQTRGIQRWNELPYKWVARERMGGFWWKEILG